MKKFLILSDLHLEFWPEELEILFNNKAFEISNALLLAGDLTNFQGLPQAVRTLRSAFQGPIFYVPGNHEFYGSDFDSTWRTLLELQREHASFHVLNNQVVEWEGHRILGTTLWFPETQGELTDEWRMNDFRQIRDFKPRVYQEHAQAVAFLDKELRKGDIVITHHLPSARSVAARFKENPLNRFFVNHLDALILERQPQLWVHGHTHDTVDYQIGASRVTCNPYGYVGHETNPKFDPSLSIALQRSLP